MLIKQSAKDEKKAHAVMQEHITGRTESKPKATINSNRNTSSPKVSVTPKPELGDPLQDFTERSFRIEEHKLSTESNKENKSKGRAASQASIAQTENLANRSSIQEQTENTSTYNSKSKILGIPSLKLQKMEVSDVTVSNKTAMIPSQTQGKGANLPPKNYASVNAKGKNMGRD